MDFVKKSIYYSDVTCSYLAATRCAEDAVCYTFASNTRTTSALVVVANGKFEITNAYAIAPFCTLILHIPIPTSVSVWKVEHGMLQVWADNAGINWKEVGKKNKTQI